MEYQEKTTHGGAQPGDWLEARGIHGEPTRRGQIVELLGGPGHEHFQVRWNEEHESIVFPAEGVRIIPRSELDGNG